MYDWMVDCGHTPHVIVDATRPQVQVPVAFVKDGRIVLNVSPAATQSLTVGNETMEFNARFGGVGHFVSVPVEAILGIYARETGEGMVFNEDATPDGDGPDSAPPQPPVAAEPAKPSRKRPSLKVVK